MKIKVLVSGAGGDVAQGVIKALTTSPLDIEVYSLCVSRYSSWLHKTTNSFLSPLSMLDEYVPFLMEFIQQHQINVFFPCVDSEILKISKNKNLIENKTNCIVMVDEESNVQITDDKYETHLFLKKNGFDTPNTCIPSTKGVVYEMIDTVGFPFIVKKRVAQGSKNIRIINSHREAREYIGEEDYILQEYLHTDNNEITAGVYLSDAGHVIGLCTFFRELRSGSTFKAKRIVNPNIDSYLEKVAKRLGMKYVNIQGRLKHNRLYIFELNGRLSGTTGIISRVFNAPELFLRERIFGEPIKRVVNNDEFYVMRYFEDIVVSQSSMDDLLDRSTYKGSVKDEPW